MDAIIAADVENTVVVTHGYAATFAIASWIAMPLDSVGYVNFRVAAGSITTLREDTLFHNREVVALGATDISAEQDEHHDRPCCEPPRTGCTAHLDRARRRRHGHGVGGDQDVSVGDFSICDGSRADIEPLTALYLRSRTAAMPWLVSPHDEPATRWWMEHVVLAAQRVRVAQSTEGVACWASRPWMGTGSSSYTSIPRLGQAASGEPCWTPSRTAAQRV